MYAADGEILYVGKARNLRRRVSSYFNRGAHNAKTQALVAQIRDLQVTVTHTEAEALILENNLIKAHRPRY
ncbi:GIY-YIG nuclease family protein, partial [Klebsiella pneumoniae]